MFAGLQVGTSVFFFFSPRVFLFCVFFSVFLFFVFSVLLYKTFIKLRFCFKLLFPPRSQGQASERVSEGAGSARGAKKTTPWCVFFFFAPRALCSFLEKDRGFPEKT